MKHSYALFFGFLLFSATSFCVAEPSPAAMADIERENFVVTGDLGSEDLTDFIEYLELRIPAVIQKYNPSYNTKVTIRLFESVDSFHKALDRPNAADYIVGVARGSSLIWMVNPYHSSVHGYTSMKKILVHEYVHLVVNSLNMGVPIWLNEGIAIHEAEQNRDSFGLNDFLRQNAKNYKLPRFDKINHNTDEVYRYAESVVLYILATYSHEKLLEFIKKPDVRAVFDVSKNEFQEGWRQYLTKL